MPTTIPPINPNVVYLDVRTGKFTPDGVRSFSQWLKRMGGVLAPSNSELEGFADAAQAAADAAQSTANTANTVAIAAAGAAATAISEAAAAQGTADGAVIDAAAAQADATQALADAAAAQADATTAIGDAAAVAADLAVHEAAADPHPQYMTQAESDALYEVLTDKDTASGYAGLNASSRTTKGVDTTDDVITDSTAKGPVMKSPNGHYWRAAISNLGVVTWTDLGTTKP